MRWLRFFRRRQWDDERARELECYLDQEIADNLVRGMSAPQAREAARFLVWTPPLPLVARGPYTLLAATAIAELPAWARRELRLPRPGIAEPVLLPPVGHGVVRAIRWAMAARR